MDNLGLKKVEYGDDNPWLARSDTFRAGRTVTIDADCIAANDNGDKIVQAGSIIGTVTTSGLSRKCTACVLVAAATDSAVDYYVDNAEAYVVGDEFTASADGTTYLTAQTITAITFDTGSGDKITVDTTLGTALDAGDYCKADDGSGTPIGVCVNTVNLRDGDALVTLAQTADLNDAGMPYSVGATTGIVPETVKTALKALVDATLSIQ